MTLHILWRTSPRLSVTTSATVVTLVLSHVVRRASKGASVRTNSRSWRRGPISRVDASLDGGPGRTRPSPPTPPCEEPPSPEHPPPPLLRDVICCVGGTSTLGGGGAVVSTD